ncbi:MAG: molecular chaperone TorD family protein [Coriobacteriaceae bacterium]|jgi:TorA maturation chaperone TorD|nr:molecular chaperone TorD family protein [Coriobacteriaceae bacterium]
MRPAETLPPEAPEHFQAKAELCQFLATVLRLPGDLLVEGIHSGAFEDELRDIADQLGLALPQPEAERCFRELAGEGGPCRVTLAEIRHAHTSLFTHPEKPLVAPYESLFRYWEKHPGGSYGEAPRMFVSPVAMDAERAYREAGLSRSPEVNEPADHISVELEFLSRLYSEKACLLLEGRLDDAAGVDKALAGFLERHIGKWGAGFFERVATSGVHPFYRLVGLVGTALVAAL